MRFRKIKHAKSRLTRICNLKAFTLAEVLITLAIIGIVAAITIPGLVQNYKRKEYSTRLKKFYSTMQQAIQMSELDNGAVNTWDLPVAVYDDENNYDYSTNYMEVKEWLNKYLLPYLNYSKVTDGNYDEESGTQKQSVTVYFLDGTKLGTFLSSSSLDLYYDVNGDNGTDSVGRENFAFSFSKSRGFTPYLNQNVSSRTDAFNKCKSLSAYCTTLLWYDNWEFKDDYPYKL